MSDDILWQAALQWWHSKAGVYCKTRVTSGPFTNIDHTRNPTVACETAEEEALALAVAARLLLSWIKGDG